MKPCLILLTLVALTGCSRLEPQFKPRAKYDALMPEAKAGVDAAMTEYFGTPTEMKIWELLPLRHSGAIGAVEETVTAEGGAVIGVKVAWEQETWPVAAGQTIGWLKEPLAIAAETKLPVVAAYDPETHVITFKEPLAAAPENGARLAIAAGEVLHHGRLLYAEHCQHCHGVSGDGNGPTAQYLNPLPRDYRGAAGGATDLATQPLFKFTSTPYTHPPARDDLSRVIENGIPGTYMPSFKLLEASEMSSIVEYVRWLSMRGVCEKLLIGKATELTAPPSEGAAPAAPADITAQLIEFLPEEAEAIVSGPWVEADAAETLVLPETERPAATPESVAIGQKLFISAAAKCSDCHGKSGLGNGTQTLAVTEGFVEPGLRDQWGHVVVPRNLRSGIYRGGRRPLDVYRRIAAGIKGTPMNAFKTNLYNLKDESLGLKGDEKDLAVWHVVNYVLSLPYEEFEPGSGVVPQMAQEAAPAKAEPAAAAGAE